MPSKLPMYLDKIIAAIIKVIIFFLPLFFLPWTSEYFEFNKQFLLWLFMPAAALLWLGKAAALGRLKIKINPLNLPILIFLSLAAAAAVFSLDRFSSFFGYFGRFSDAWLGLFSLVIFYFLAINTGIADSAKKIIELLKLFFYSAVLVAAAFLAALAFNLGAASGLPAGQAGLPFSVFSSVSFNPAGGSLSALAVYLAIASVLAANFLVGARKKIDRIIFGSGLAIFLIALILINFPLSWAFLLIGSGLIIFFRLLGRSTGLLAQTGQAAAIGQASRAKEGSGPRKIFNSRLKAPAILVLAAAFFLIWPNLNPANLILGRQLPREALLEYGPSLTIAGEALSKYPALGSGPGTFAHDFSLYRPAELNQSPFWPIRFDKSGSQFLEMLATAGLLTSLSHLLVISLAVYLNIVLMRKHLKTASAGQSLARAGRLTDEDYNLIVGIFIAFILIFFSQLFFPANTVLNFIFWLCLSLAVAFWQSRGQILFKEKIINLKRKVLFYRLSVLALFILGAGWFALLAFEVKFFAADIIAAKQTSEANLLKAIRLNPYRHNYQISLAKFYLSRVRAGVLASPEQRNNSIINLNIAAAVAAAKAARDQAPNSVLAAETLGMVYRDIGPLTIGSQPWAVKAFERSFGLEPTNPVLAGELAKANLNNNDLAAAEKYFIKALELKGNYSEAKFGLAQTYLNQKKDNQALMLLKELARRVKRAEAYYELGKFYYNHGEISRAIDEFKLALDISPAHLNSLYSLGIAYETQGQTQEALKYFKKVLELNPGNKEAELKVKEFDNK